jgi:hypothetical protein
MLSNVIRAAMTFTNSQTGFYLCLVILANIHRTSEFVKKRLSTSSNQRTAHRRISQEEFKISIPVFHRVKAAYVWNCALTGTDRTTYWTPIEQHTERGKRKWHKIITSHLSSSNSFIDTNLPNSTKSDQNIRIDVTFMAHSDLFSATYCCLEECCFWNVTSHGLVLINVAEESVASMCKGEDCLSREKSVYQGRSVSIYSPNYMESHLNIRLSEL